MRRVLALGAAILLAIAGSQWLADDHGPAQPAATAPAQSRTIPATPAPSDQAPADRSATGSLVVRSVAVRDVDGRVAWRGDVDLAPTLQRIAAGKRDPHRNDGGVFGNRERQLPAHPRGYYREYVVRTPGLSHAGPQRLIVGAGGELYYTPDHYGSFRRLR